MSDTTLDNVFDALRYRREVDAHGVVRYYDDNGRLHRDSGPAVIHPCGAYCWYRHGMIHRDGGPAIKRKDGTELWLSNYRLHRLDGPAVTGPDGVERWYQDGLPTNLTSALVGPPDIKLMPSVHSSDTESSLNNLNE